VKAIKSILEVPPKHVKHTSEAHTTDACATDASGTDACLKVHFG
jgi:hypothetical protein